MEYSFGEVLPISPYQLIFNAERHIELISERNVKLNQDKIRDNLPEEIRPDFKRWLEQMMKGFNQFKALVIQADSIHTGVYDISNDNCYALDRFTNSRDSTNIFLHETMHRFAFHYRRELGLVGIEDGYQEENFCQAAEGSFAYILNQDRKGSGS